MDRLLTIRQAAEFLGVSERTVRRLIESGDIPVYHPTKQVFRISERELHRRVYGAMDIEAPEAEAAR